jgi:hypothetical protein
MLAKFPAFCKTIVRRNKLPVTGRKGFSRLAHDVNTAYPLVWVCAGPLATANRELRQARKGAAVTGVPGAGVWLARAFLLIIIFPSFQTGRFPETLVK